MRISGSSCQLSGALAGFGVLYPASIIHFVCGSGYGFFVPPQTLSRAEEFADSGMRCPLADLDAVSCLFFTFTFCFGVLGIAPGFRRMHDPGLESTADILGPRKS